MLSECVIVLLVAANLLFGRIADFQTLSLSKLCLEFGHNTHLGVAVDLHRDLHLRLVNLLHGLTLLSHLWHNIFEVQEVIIELNQ